MTISYRSEIDGLRALAVLPVVAFHAGMPSVTGGFVGVDVFFVISGFLITGNLATHARDGRLSIASFYKRRLRRIAPALLTVLAACAAAAFTLLLPGQLIEFGKSLIATEVFASNIWFWQGAGYFRAQGGIVPLLHTWSLAVEEQFYLFMPLLVMASGRKLKLLCTVVVVATLFSFAASVIGVSRMPGAAFYLLPTRAWELLLGSVLALGAVPPVRSAIGKEIASWIGLALIVASVVLLNESTAFPGLAALPATVGAGLFIWSADQTTSAGRVMGYAAIVLIGKISYSLYLWHWPVIIFTRQYLGTDISGTAMAGAVVISVAAAFATWRWVETPTRDALRWSDRQLVIGSSISALAIGAFAVVIIWNEGFPNRFAPSVTLLESGAADYSPIAKRCGLSSSRILSSCHIGGAGQTFLLAGDSHAGGIAEAVDLAAKAASRGGILTTYNACPALVAWQPTVGTAFDREGCALRNRRLFERLRSDPAITMLIIANYWPPLARANLGKLHAAVRQTVTFAHRANKRLVFLHGLPEPGFDVPWQLAVASAHGRKGTLYVKRPVEIFPHEREVFINLSNALCSGTRCAVSHGRRSLYVDGNHLSAYADRVVIAPFLIRKRVFD